MKWVKLGKCCSVPCDSSALLDQSRLLEETDEGNSLGFIDRSEHFQIGVMEWCDVVSLLYTKTVGSFVGQARTMDGAVKLSRHNQQEKEQEGQGYSTSYSSTIGANRRERRRPRVRQLVCIIGALLEPALQEVSI